MNIDFFYAIVNIMHMVLRHGCGCYCSCGHCDCRHCRLWLLRRHEFILCIKCNHSRLPFKIPYRFTFLSNLISLLSLTHYHLKILSEFGRMYLSLSYNINTCVKVFERAYKNNQRYAYKLFSVFSLTSQNRLQI